MTEFQLNAIKREKKPNQLRREGLIPAVVYGNDFDNVSIGLEKIPFMKLFKEAGSSNLIDLKIGDGKNFKTLIQDIQLDPITNEILHVDLFKVNMKEKIHAEIPLRFIGDSTAVIEQEGTLITPKTSIEVECLPADLIPELEIDISVLDDFEKDIRVSNLAVPTGVEILDDPEEVIAHVEEPRSEEELAALEEAVEENVEDVEVEHKGEEEAAEGEEGAGAETEEKKEE